MRVGASAKNFAVAPFVNLVIVYREDPMRTGNFAWAIAKLDSPTRLVCYLSSHIVSMRTTS
jgi:hypothetical protein